MLTSAGESVGESGALAFNQIKKIKVMKLFKIALGILIIGFTCCLFFASLWYCIEGTFIDAFIDTAKNLIRLCGVISFAVIILLLIGLGIYLIEK